MRELVVVFAVGVVGCSASQEPIAKDNVTNTDAASSTGAGGAGGDGMGGDNAPAADVVVETTCNKTFNPSGATMYYAEAAFPGASYDELARVRVILTYVSTTEFGFPPNYTRLVTSAYVRDGFAAHMCGATDDFIESVTFILPGE